MRIIITSLALMSLLIVERTGFAWISVAPEPSLADRVADRDTVVFAELVASQRQEKSASLLGSFRIEHVARASEDVSSGQVVEAAHSPKIKPGMHMLLTWSPRQARWRAELPVSRAAFNYAISAPPPDSPSPIQIAYYLSHFSSADRQIQQDAFRELNDPRFEFLLPFVDRFPRNWIRARLKEGSAIKNQIALMGIMLGLCGDDSDKELLRSLVAEVAEHDGRFRLGVDGLISGYLALAGEEGLDWIEENRLRNPNAAFFEKYCVLQALRFLARCRQGHIPLERLVESVSLILDMPEMDDLAIAELTRWNDWSRNGRIIELLPTIDDERKWTRYAIYRHLLVCSQTPPEVQADEPEVFQTAQRVLNEARENDREGLKRIGLFLLAKRNARLSHASAERAASGEADVINRLKKLGATVFQTKGEVVEINANRTKITNADLEGVAAFTEITDLSLEETSITTAGLKHLGTPGKLVWLNLYRTEVDDDALKLLANWKSLKLLPIGETKVTDKGLSHIRKLSKLTYLGLRGNAITDKGVAELAELKTLEELYLGETKITDGCLSTLSKLPKLQKLWLNKTAISDKSIPQLAKMKRLRQLFIEGSQITEDGAKKLQAMMPSCQIVYETD